MDNDFACLKDELGKEFFFKKGLKLNSIIYDKGTSEFIYDGVKYSIKLKPKEIISKLNKHSYKFNPKLKNILQNNRDIFKDYEVVDKDTAKVKIIMNNENLRRCPDLCSLRFFHYYSVSYFIIINGFLQINKNRLYLKDILIEKFFFNREGERIGCGRIVKSKIPIYKKDLEYGCLSSSFYFDGDLDCNYLKEVTKDNLDWWEEVGMILSEYFYFGSRHFIIDEDMYLDIIKRLKGSTYTEQDRMLSAERLPD